MPFRIRHTIYVASLLLVVIVPARADRQSAAADTTVDSPTMMLSVTQEDSRQKNAAGLPLAEGTWARDFFRQHLLMVARERFGMRTRDGQLAEPVDTSSNDCFHLRARLWETGNLDVEYRRGKQLLLEKSVPDIEYMNPTTFRLAAEEADNMTDAVVGMLSNLGFEPRPRREGTLTELPQEIEDLLLQMNYVSQFAAARQLHQLMDKDGESAAVLSGLTRVYAHLAQLTIPLVDLKHRAFAARSLVYSTRLCARDWDSPVGFWNRAYTMVWLGHPKGASQELGAAGRRADEATAEPNWLPLLQHYIDYDFAALENLAANKESRWTEQAALFWALAARMTRSDNFALEVGHQVRVVLPHSPRLNTLMRARAGVSAKHSLVPQGRQLQYFNLRRNLSAIEDLPDCPDLQDITAPRPDTKPASGILSFLFGNQAESENDDLPADSDSDYVDETWPPAIADRLEQAGQDDQQEPSWHVLAGCIRGWQTEQLFAEVSFLRSSLGTDAGDHVRETIGQLSEEQYRPLYQAFGAPQQAPAEVISPITRDMAPLELNNASVLYDLMRYSIAQDAQIAGGTISDISERMYEDRDDLEETARRLLTNSSGPVYVDWLHWIRENITENAPGVLAELIARDWKEVSQHAEEWGQQHPQSADIQWALGRGNKLYGDLEKSIRHYDQYVSMTDEPGGYIGLAEAWYMHEDSDFWLEVLQDVFQVEDHHLNHSVAACHAAATLMHDGRFDDALPWAERAAGSYAHWAVACYIECLTAVGDAETAEQLASQMTVRYESDDWYRWCVSTGQGDLQAAWKAWEQLLHQRNWMSTSDGIFARAWHALARDDPQAALTALREITDEQVRQDNQGHLLWGRILAAVVADRLERAEERDMLLKPLMEVRNQSETNQAVAMAADWIMQDKGHGRMPDQQIRAWTSVGAENNWSLTNQSAAVTLGYYMWTHGKKDLAIRMWKGPACCTPGILRAISWHWLRQAGVDPIHLEERVFDRAFRRRQLKQQ